MEANLLNVLYQLTVMVLVVFGLAIVFGLLGIMNMAHGDFIMLGAYAAVGVQLLGAPPWLGVAAAIALTASIGLVVERWLLRPLASRPFDTLLATWGLGILLRKAVEAAFGRGYQNVETTIQGTVHVLGTPYPAYRCVLMLVVFSALATVAWWYRGSAAGARLKAAVTNPTLAEAIGLDTRRTASIAFIVGVGSAGLAGALLAPIVRIEPAMGIDYLLSGFFVLVVGGLGSLAGLLTGSALIGGTQSLVSTYWSASMASVVTLLVAMLFLWRKPSGLVRPG